MNTQIKRGDINMNEEETIMKKDILERAIALGKLSETEYTRVKALDTEVGSQAVICNCDSGAGARIVKIEDDRMK